MDTWGPGLSVQLHLAPSWSIRPESMSHSLHLRAFEHTVWNALPLVCLLTYHFLIQMSPPQGSLLWTLRPCPMPQLPPVALLKALFHSTYQLSVTCLWLFHYGLSPPLDCKQAWSLLCSLLCVFCGGQQSSTYRVLKSFPFFVRSSEHAFGWEPRNHSYGTVSFSFDKLLSKTMLVFYPPCQLWSWLICLAS